MKLLAFFVLVATAANAQVTVHDLSELKVTPLPFPKLNPDSFTHLALNEIQSRADMLAETLGRYPLQFKRAEDRQGTYAVWSEVLAAAQAIEAKEGDSEPMAHVLAELYREGHNLDVQDCGERASAILELGLKKFPDSIPLNFEAAHYYLDVGKAIPAESALIHLRVLLHTTEDIRIERPLLFAYLYQDKRSEALKQVDHCLEIQPGDPFYAKTKETLAKGGWRRIRVPMGSPNEVTLKGTPTIHFALDRPYNALEINPKDGAAKKDIRAYMFVPNDGQSAANLAMGSDAHFQTEAGIAAMHEGAQVTKVKGMFNDTEIELWRYHDSQHLYSTFWFTATDSAGVSRRIEIDLVANTQQRLEALEKAFSVIDFL
jgi:tetratricopeptide (TPR) repeat protein